MLHVWTIVERWDGANLLDGIFASIAMRQIAVVIAELRVSAYGTFLPVVVLPIYGCCQG